MSLTDEELRAAELRCRRWSVAISGLGVLGVAGSIFFGFTGIHSHWEAQQRNLRAQWGQEFFNERLHIYSRATEAAARIAALKQSTESTEDHAREVERAVIEFRTLYWGPMCMTEGVDVLEAMVMFDMALKAGLPPPKLGEMALHLAHVCGNEVHSVYQDIDSRGSRLRVNESILNEMKLVVGAR